MIKGQEHFSHEESLRDLELFSIENKWLGVTLSMCPSYLKDRARVFSVMTRDRTRDNGHRQKHRKFCLNTVSEGGRALAQVAQGGYGVSILGDIQKPFGQNPGQLFPDGSEGLEEMISREANMYRVYLHHSNLNHSLVQ